MVSREGKVKRLVYPAWLKPGYHALRLEMAPHIHLVMHLGITSGISTDTSA
jgi:hypothetical protein